MFGVVAPANAAPDDEAILDEATLKQFNPAFNGIGSGEIEILVQRSLFYDPFVYMPPDVTANNWIPNVGLPTTYGIPGLEVIFKYIDTIDPITGLLVQGEELIEAAVGFTDTQFRFTVDQTPEAQFLIPNMFNDYWGDGVVKSSLPNCPMYYAAVTIGVKPSKIIYHPL
ncbi:MAG: hypothetical protein HZA16_09080 [Nitrospirae bacterium]|nr:hypothetical protein [Nitrospirota bacterium]